MNTGSREKKDQAHSDAMTRKRHDRTKFPKMILVAGDGRNVGKTTFSTKIIRHLSSKAAVIGLKTTPHSHVLSDGLEIIAQTEHYLVAREKGIHDKDSGLLLKAGAEEVFLIMAAQQFLEEAFSWISENIQHKICIAESGGLVEFVKPAVFFFVRHHAREISKRGYFEFKPVVVTNRDWTFDFAIEQLDVVHNELVMNK